MTVHENPPRHNINSKHCDKVMASSPRKITSAQAPFKYVYLATVNRHSLSCNRLWSQMIIKPLHKNKTGYISRRTPSSPQKLKIGNEAAQMTHLLQKPRRLLRVPFHGLIIDVRYSEAGLISVGPIVFVIAIYEICAFGGHTTQNYLISLLRAIAY